ncbi:LysM peptidoglycan-binding domain-containing protein [Streptococcus sp. M334]|uniref:LysM peptidoglycan-binding domain-containing protein n=1 Tax=Streptococcus sp. M334 TaxID=563038 RepID=UPI00031F8E7C|nr:LysM domain-containing protein [Streptococcus sp. M334]
MRQTNVRGTLSLRGFRKLRTGAIVATGVILLGLGFLAPTVSANEQDGVWVARTVTEVKADIQNIDNLSHYTIKWGDTLSAISGATGLSVDSLVEINRIANRDLIFANNKLYFSEESFLKDGNTEVKRQRVSIDNSGSCQSYEVETKTDTVTGEQTTTVKQTTPVVVETPAVSVPKSETSASVAPKSDEPAGTEPKTEEPAATTPKADEPVVTTPKAEEPAGTEPKTDEPAGTIPKAEEPAATTPKSDEPAAGITPKAEEPATPAPKVEEPATPASKVEEPAATTPKADEPVVTTPKAEEPAAITPKAENSSEEVEPKDEKLEEAKKEGKDIIEGIASSKLSEIEKVKDEAEKTKLKEKLNGLKEEALAAINNAKDYDAAVAAADEYQTKIDEIDVPGEELPAPNYNKDNLTNGRNEGTTIDNGSTVIGHGSGEATATSPTQPAAEARSTSTASPTQPSSTSEGTSSFRNAPSVQARARRVARSTSEPDGTVNISYNFAGMPDIHGFLSDPGEDNTVTIPAGTSEAQAKELVKEKIQAKIKDLATRGYHVKNDIIFEQDTTVKNYNYVVTFTKEATGTSGFRMAPAVQPRASRNRRSLEQPAPQKVKVNVFYNFDQMKDIAGFLGDIDGTSLEIAEGSTNEQVKAAVKSQVDAKKEELSKRGYTFKEDYVYQANGKDYNYVVTFSKATK